MNILKRFDHIFAQFIKFGIVGLSNTVLSYAIYASLVYLGLHYLAASVIAFVVSVANSFFWNNKYVFKDESGNRSVWRVLVRTYVSYAFSGLVISNMLLYLFIDVLDISKYIAPILGLSVTVPLNYILNRQWAFKPKKCNKES